LQKVLHKKQVEDPENKIYYTKKGIGVEGHPYNDVSGFEKEGGLLHPSKSDRCFWKVILITFKVIIKTLKVIEITFKSNILK